MTNMLFELDSILSWKLGILLAMATDFLRSWGMDDLFDPEDIILIIFNISIK